MYKILFKQRNKGIMAFNKKGEETMEVTYEKDRKFISTYTYDFYVGTESGEDNRITQKVNHKY